MENKSKIHYEDIVSILLLILVVVLLTYTDYLRFQVYDHWKDSYEDAIHEIIRCEDVRHVVEDDVVVFKIISSKEVDFDFKMIADSFYSIQNNIFERISKVSFVILDEDGNVIDTYTFERVGDYAKEVME